MCGSGREGEGRTVYRFTHVQRSHSGPGLLLRRTYSNTKYFVVVRFVVMLMRADYTVGVRGYGRVRFEARALCRSLLDPPTLHYVLLGMLCVVVGTIVP